MKYNTAGFTYIASQAKTTWEKKMEGPQSYVRELGYGTGSK